MTFRITIRGATTGTIDLEYLCAHHGRFTASVVRTDSPDFIPCKLDPFCREQCWWSPSRAPTVSIPIVGAVSHARDQERPHDGFMSTRAIAEGQSVAEWKKERAAYWEERRKEHVMAVKR